MRFFIFVCGDRCCRRFQLSKDKSDYYQILLPDKEFFLERTVSLKLCNVAEEWYICEADKYKLKREEFFRLERQIKDGRALYRLNTGRKYSIIIENTVIYIQLVFHKSDWSLFEKFELKECEITRDKHNIFLGEIKGINIKKKDNIKFLYRQGNWLLNNDEEAGVYVNGISAEREQKLIYGDVIYIFNIMFIFLGAYLAIEETEDKITYCVKSNYLNKVILDDKAEKKNSILIVQKEKFHRAPRVMETLEQSTIHIEAPPMLNVQKERSAFMDIGSVITMMIPMLGMNLFLIYGTKAEQAQVGLYMYSGIFMAVMSTLCSVLWIIISRKYEQKEQEKKINKKKHDYRKYLSKQDACIKKQYEITKKVLQSRYLRADNYLNNPLLEMYLWNRNPYHKDFLIHRVGIGDMKFPANIELVREGFSMEKDLLWKEAEEIQRHYAFLHQMPILLDMKKYDQIGIIGEEKRSMDLIRSILLQIALNNCYTEVKVVCVYDGDKPGQSEQWDFCRWLPHIWNNNGQRRYIATCYHEARQLFYELFQIFKEREKGENKPQQLLPHYILFITEHKFLEGEMFSKYIFDKDTQYGLTVVWITSERDKLPNTCRLVLEVNKVFSGQYEIDRHSQNQKEIIFDYTEKEVADKLIRSISGIRVTEVEEKTGIPERIDFLEMYGAKKIEELEIEKRWKTNRIFESARVLIGKKAEGESCYLDIHERYHGPHGLLAGTTGSGKSEVLQTFILSMAVNFSPEAVNFLLIDYKGEGMAGLFSKLPHISGKISNLAEGQAYRAMISIKSENRRRQTIFKEAKVNNINDYTRLYLSGRITEPIPHLLIIIDEFAELKKAEPEFMQELISIAQVGRSLGIHLVLATQKPGGVVDDKIWSNSRFRICLKVQEREDSMDMLHNIDACSITHTGRGYLQVGNNELYELFQAGWSGAPFQKEIRKPAAQMMKIDGTAFVVDSESVEEDTDLYGLKKEIQSEAETQITQLQAVNNYIEEITGKLGYKPVRKLWMEPLPHHLYLERVLKQNKIEKMRKIKKTGEGRSDYLKGDLQSSLEDKSEVCVGIFDNPENQEQPVFSLKLLESGHIAICGRSVSGKSTFLQTFIYSLLENDLDEDISLYLFDFNGGGMNIYSSVPQVKFMLQEDEGEKLDKIFKSIVDELRRRKKYFSGGNFRQYQSKRENEKQKKEDFPLILIILDGFVEFSEETYQRYEEDLYFILREGEKLGVLLIISVESFSSMHISMRLSELFKTKICFYMKDTYAYTEVFDVIQIPILPKKGIAGRGIACYGEKLLEFQTALAIEARDDYERQEKIMALLDREKINVC